MRVLYFHQHFTTPKDNGGTRSYELAKKLIEKGHKVTMVCGKTVELDLPIKKSETISKGNIDGINVIQINLSYSNKDGLFKRAIGFLKFAFNGIKIINKEKFDLVFATSTPLTAGIPALWMKIFNKNSKKFIFEVRDLWPELPKALGLKNKFLLWGMKVLESSSYNRSDGCIGLSPGICDGIHKTLNKDIPVTMIPNGCDLDIFKPLKNKKLELKGIDNSDFVAVFTGAHGIANGLEAVLDLALELIKRKRKDIKIAFIGSGKLKDSLIERAESEGLNNCFFYDPVPKIELNKIVANANVGLMVLKNIPEFYYGTSPNKFFDYISSGIPVVNNYPGWIADMINKYEIGEAVDPDNSLLFADAIEKLADNHILAKKYGKNARILAEKSFSRDDLSEKFVGFIEEIQVINNTDH